MTTDELKELLGKVTHGEWVWYGPEYGGEYDSNEGGLGGLYSGDVEICHFGDNTNYYNSCGKPPSDANATLIAIAPQLARRVITAENRISKLESLVAKAALYAECAFDDRPNRQGINGAIDWQDGYRDGTIAAASAIRNAAKETT